MKLVFLFSVLGLVPSILLLLAALLLGPLGLDVRILVLALMGIIAVHLIPCGVAGLAAGLLSPRIKSPLLWISACGCLGFVLSLAFLVAVPVLPKIMLVLVGNAALAGAGCILAAIASMSWRRRSEPPPV